jgi:fatty acyl-CoA reductase
MNLIGPFKLQHLAPFSKFYLIFLQCFDTVRESHPEALDKVVPISGDISEPNLGISEEDAKLMSDNVSVIFHLAATVKFDAPLR